jgi:hypothetical protein
MDLPEPSVLKGTKKGRCKTTVGDDPFAGGTVRMPCTIVSNNIASPHVRENVSKAICDAIGDRLGEWSVVVYQAVDYPGLAVRIQGPKGLRWNWTFFGEEQSPEFIQQRIASGITG